MARGVSSSTIPASGGEKQAGGRGMGSNMGSLREVVSGCIWFGLGGKMGSFCISLGGGPNGGGGWLDERIMPAPL